MQAWEKFLLVQESALGKDVVDSWLRSLKVVRFDACNLYLEATDSFQALWFEEHIRPKLKHSLFNHNQTPIKVHLTIGTAQLPFRKKGTGRKQQSDDAPSLPPFTLTFDHPDPLATLENFVVSENNELAHRLLSELCQSAVGFSAEKSSVQLGTYNPIFLYGDSGCGKTHLLAAVMHSLLKNDQRVIYARAETFTDHVVHAIRAGEMHLFRQAYRNTDVLIIDDVHVFARKSATQEELFHTFNTLHMAGKQIILSSHLPPSELQHIEPRLTSRFEWGIVVEVGNLSPKELRQLIVNKSDALKFPLNPRIVDYLLETFRSSPKALIKALEALILRSHLSHASQAHISSTAISVNQARLYLTDLTKSEHDAMLTPEKILKHIAEHFGIKVDDILGKSQSRECSLPRQLAAFLCRDLLKLPYKKIGDLLGRDHSTVMTSIKQIQKQNESNNEKIIAPLKAIQTILKTRSCTVPTERVSEEILS